MTTWRRSMLSAVLVLPLMALAGCSAGGQAAGSAGLYDSFEKTGSAIGCLSLSNSEAETTDIEENKYCQLAESAVGEGGSVTIYQYADAIHRDKSVSAGVVQGQSFLLLSDTWSLSGDVRDLRRIKAQLGVGELRSAAPEEPTGPGTVSSAEKEPSLDDGGAVPVPGGKSVTLDGEKVQVGSIYCNTLSGENHGSKNKKFDSCRKSALTDTYGDTTKAAKGDEFFLVAVRWRNVGKKPVAASDFGTLITTDGTEYALDEEQSTSLTSVARGNTDVDMSGSINPGKSYRILLAYEIPKRSKVKAIHWGLGEYGTEPPAYALAVR